MQASEATVGPLFPSMPMFSMNDVRTAAALLFAILFSSVMTHADPPPGFQSEIVVVGIDQPTVIKFLQSDSPK